MSDSPYRTVKIRTAAYKRAKRLVQALVRDGTGDLDLPPDLAGRAPSMATVFDAATRALEEKLRKRR